MMGLVLLQEGTPESLLSLSLRMQRRHRLQVSEEPLPTETDHAVP